MSEIRRAVFESYRPGKILNKNKRADHWFWSRYSAYPYLGCQHGCAFCYCRESKYSPYEDAGDFAFRIRVKENAAILLRRELSRCPVDVLFTADYQPLERKFRVSRGMLEACCDLGFPVMILERSPLVLRDLDVIQTIQKNSAAVVAFSIIHTEKSRHLETIGQMEGLAPSPTKRFAAMEKLSAAGITTGACMMPLLPGLCDDRANVEEIIRRTAGCGGKFILIGGLTLGDQQKDYFLNVLKKRFPALLPVYQKMYPPGSYGPEERSWNRTALIAAEYCRKHGIADRMPRPVIPGEKREFNKRLAEILADQSYHLEIEGKTLHEVWNFRKGAWAVEDLEQDIRLVFKSMGCKGLTAIPGLAGQALALVEKSVLKSLDPNPEENDAGLVSGSSASI